MTKNFNFEYILGLIILFLSIFSLIYVLSKVDLFQHSKNNLTLESSFFDIGALSVGADVKVRGVKVGEVVSISLDSDTYLALVTTSYENNILIPKDSIFKIAESGFTAPPYIEVELGASKEFFIDKDSTKNNVDAISLEEIINNFIFN